jgi:hypothetical protein
MGRKNRTLDVIWQFVKKAGPDECWQWLGTKYRNEKGSYGKIAIHGRQYRAHRLIYELSYGVTLERRQKFARESQVIMHTCDNPLCCNPAHLKLGTPSDNVWDMVRKGRRHNFDGERGANAKLTNEQAALVRKLAHAKFPQKEISRMFGISVPTVSGIKHGIVYKET